MSGGATVNQRRHFLYKEQETENCVCHGADTNLLRLWLARREQLMQDEHVTRYLVFFWDLAKPTTAITLSSEHYIDLFSRAAMALVQTVGESDQATQLAQRDWCYDSHDNATLTLNMFKHALFETAELLLPVESDASMLSSFFLELRDAIATPDVVEGAVPLAITSTIAQSTHAPSMYEAVGYKFRPMRDVHKIRGAFLQKLAPSSDQLALISGLTPPDPKTMSLKQLLLSYNPRKHALSRKFSSLFATSATKSAVTRKAEVPLPVASDNIDEIKVEENAVMMSRTSPTETSVLLNKVSQDPYDYEIATIEALNQFPALRVAVVGPPGAGKTRVAKHLAKKLDLQYYSLSIALTSAITSKEAQDLIRAQRRQVAAEKADAMAVAGETQGLVGSTDESASMTPLISAVATDESPLEEDLLFADADYAAIRNGEALPRKKVLALLVHAVQKLVHSGVGVVLDDVYPHEVEGELAIDYIVILESTREDAWKHFGGLEVEPTTMRVYSQRELAMLSDCDAVLQEKGMADVARVQEWLDTTTSQPKTVTEVEVPLTDERESDFETREGEVEAENETIAALKPRKLTAAERNDVQAPSEATVSLQPLLLNSFRSRYHEYLDRSASTRARTTSSIASGRTHVVAVLATQSLQGIISQCVYEITNSQYGLSRSAASRLVFPLTLPEEMATSESRSDRLRWLLYGDWSDIIASAPSTLATSITTQSRRQLSRWKQCCVVTYAREGVLVPGDPLYASYFSGRVYLSASEKYRELFCAFPLSYLNIEPPTPPLIRKIWLLSPGTLDQAMLGHVKAAIGADIVNAKALVTAHQELHKHSALQEGQSLSGKQCGEITAEVLTAVGNAWVLTDLMPSTDALAVMKERGCLPDVVVTLVHHENLPLDNMMDTLQERKVELMRASNEGVAAARADFMNAVSGLGIPMKNSIMYSDALDTTAALLRVLSPLASRVDAIDDGTMNTVEEGISTFTPSEIVESGNGESQGIDDSAKYKRKLMGETAQFCPVTWFTHQTLVPGQPSFVTSFNQKYYAFATQQALTQFQRDPERYVTVEHVLRPSATRAFTPMILLLGARGCDQDHLVERLSTSLTQRQRVVVVDYQHVRDRTQNRLKVQSLLPTDKPGILTSDQIYAFELQSELDELRSRADSNTVIILNGLGNSTNGTKNEATIPSVELLVLLFELGVYPSLVVALDPDEEVVVARRLERWRFQLPPLKRRLTTTKRNGDDEPGDGIESEGDLNLEELEDEERVKFQEQYKSDEAALALALQWLYSRGGANAKHVRLAGTQRVIDKRLHKVVQEHLVHKNTLFEYSERVPVEQAQHLIRSGDALIGHHGTNCPLSVRLQPVSIQNPLESALLVRGRLYFPRDTDAFQQCESQPSLPMEIPMWAPSFRPTCCVVGPPGVGRTRLARTLAVKYGLVYVSPRTAIDWVQQCNGGTALWDKLKAASAPFDTDLVHEVLAMRLRSGECRRDGWVLDDYFQSSAEVDLSLKPGQSNHTIYPALIFMLDGNIHDSWTKLHRQQQHISPESTSTIDDAVRYERHVIAFANYQSHRLDLLNTWITTFGAYHVRQIDTTNISAWHIWTQASSAVNELIWRSRDYRCDRANGKVANLYGVLRSLTDLVQKQHPVFSTFCPVSLAASRFHWSCSQQRTMCVEFNDAVYWLAPNETRFHLSPSTFLDPDSVERAQQRLVHAPVDASLLSLFSVPDCDFPEMKGYCPVTFKHGTGDKDWAAIVKGSIFYRVSVGNQVFYFVSEEARRQFLFEPTLFAGLTLPIELPPLLSSSLVAKNGIGRLEQELSGVLNETLVLLGSLRPKYLQANVAASACVYLALVLKIRAKTLPRHIRALYAERLKEFERECRLGETIKAAMASPGAPAACGSGMKGVRAVLTGVHESEDGGVTDSVKNASAQAVTHATMELSTLHQRFDEITQAKSRSLVVFTSRLPHNTEKRN